MHLDRDGDSCQELKRTQADGRVHQDLSGVEAGNRFVEGEASVVSPLGVAGHFALAGLPNPATQSLDLAIQREQNSAGGGHDKPTTLHRETTEGCDGWKHSLQIVG